MASVRGQWNILEPAGEFSAWPDCRQHTDWTKQSEDLPILASEGAVSRPEALDALGRSESHCWVADVAATFQTTKYRLREEDWRSVLPLASGNMGNHSSLGGRLEALNHNVG